MDGTTKNLCGFGASILLVGLAVCGALAKAESWKEFRIARGSQPQVDGSIVVWDDGSSVGVADISDPDRPEIFSVRGDGRAAKPRVSGHYIVWEDWLHGTDNVDIVAVDLNDPARESFTVWADPNTEDHWPDIDGNCVVWTAWGIGVPGTWLRFAVLADGAVASTYAMRPFDDLPLYPRISGDLVVWYEDNTGNAVGVDIADPNDPVVFEIGPGLGGKWYTEVDGQWVIWSIWQGGSPAFQLYADNLFDPYPPLIVTHDAGADIAENIVVWAERRDGNTDVYAYNLATDVEFRITDNEADQGSPAIAINREKGHFVVVWSDLRNHPTEIYGMILDGPLVAGCVSYLPGDINRDCQVDRLDFALLAENWLASSQAANPFAPEPDDDTTEEPDDEEPSRRR